MSQGKLFYVIGASGVGKDSLLRYARSHLQQSVVFAHRYITRPVELTGENHIELSEAEFLTRQQAGCFKFYWQAHGLYYGLGVELDDWLQRGLSVVMNGSRAYLNTACDLHPNIVPVLIKVDTQVLKSRLEARGRESAEEISHRLERAKDFDCLEHPNLLMVENNQPLELSGDIFVAQIQRYLTHHL